MLKEKLTKICEDNGVVVMPFGKVASDYEPSFDGMAFEYGDITGIAYNDKLSEHGQAAVLAHEVGHIFMGHKKREFKGAIDEKMVEREEFEARVFAAVIMALNVYSAERNT